MVNDVVPFPDSKWIAAQLQANGISQKDLAMALGFHASGVTRLLSGARSLRTEELPKMIAFLRERGVRSVDPEVIRIGLTRASNLEALASAMQMPSRRLHDIVKGDEIADAEIARLAWIVDLPPEAWLDRASGVAQSEAGTVPVYAAPRWIAGGWSQGRLSLVENRPAPARLLGSQGGFGMYVETDQLSPMFRPGDIAYMLPGAPVIVGSRALAKAENDRWALGIVEEGPRSSVLRWHEHHRPIPLPPETSLYRVVAVDFQ